MKQNNGMAVDNEHKTWSPNVRIIPRTTMQELEAAHHASTSKTSTLDPIKENPC